MANMMDKKTQEEKKKLQKKREIQENYRVHQNFVYYKNLKTYQPEIFKEVNEVYNSAEYSITNRFSGANVSTFLASMAEAERVKEETLLRQFYWNNEINNSNVLVTKGDLISYINYLMQGKDVFEYAIRRILGRDGTGEKSESKQAIGEFLITGAGHQKMSLDKITELLEAGKLQIGGRLITRLNEKIGKLLEWAITTTIQETMGQSQGSVEEMGKNLQDITQMPPYFKEKILDKVSTFYEQEVDNAVFEAINDIFDMRVFNDSNLDDNPQLLKKLKDFVNKGSRGAGSGITGQLLEGLKKVYGLTGPVYEDMMQLLTGAIDNSNTDIEQFKTVIGKELSSHLYLRKAIQLQNYGKGISQEEFESFVFNATQEGVRQLIEEGLETGIEYNQYFDPDKMTFKFSSLRTGGSDYNKSKADNAFLFGIDSKYFNETTQKVFNEAKKKIKENNSRISASSIRGVNTAAWREVQAHWNTLDKVGFVVYSSSKISSATNDDSWGGFFAETDRSLLHLQEAFRGAVMKEKGDFLISAIENSMKKAIYAGHTAELTRGIAQNLAYFLFDDFKTIGDDLESNLAWGHGINAVHLMYLNGVYIPLSVLLEGLSKAVLSVDQEDIKAIINPTIHYNGAASIAYEKGPWTKEEWISQRNIALNEIKVEIRIMKSFTDFIIDLYGKKI